MSSESVLDKAMPVGRKQMSVNMFQYTWTLNRRIYNILTYWTPFSFLKIFKRIKMKLNVLNFILSDIFISFIKSVRYIGHTWESQYRIVDIHKITTEYLSTSVYDRMQIWGKTFRSEIKKFYVAIKPYIIILATTLPNITDNPSRPCCCKTSVRDTTVLACHSSNIQSMHSCF
jgi:hypothetical protein